MNRVATINKLKKRGWTVTEKRGLKFRLPANIVARYPRLPDSLFEFLSGMTKCEDRAQTTWFLCQSDYEGTSGSAFAWDEWEKLSLSADPDNPKYTAEVRAFWDVHFPFLFSVHSGYAYYAICTVPDRFGQVVEGSEPMFEEVSFVADSFEDFLPRFLREKRKA